MVVGHWYPRRSCRRLQEIDLELTECRWEQEGETRGRDPPPPYASQNLGVVPDRFTALQPGDGANIAIKLKVIARTRQGLPSLESHMLERENFFIVTKQRCFLDKKPKLSRFILSKKQGKPSSRLHFVQLWNFDGANCLQHSKLSLDSDSRNLHCLKIVPPLGFSAARDASQL